MKNPTLLESRHLCHHDGVSGFRELIRCVFVVLNVEEVEEIEARKKHLRQLWLKPP